MNIVSEYLISVMLETNTEFKAKLFKLFRDWKMVSLIISVFKIIKFINHRIRKTILSVSS